MSEIMEELDPIVGAAEAARLLGLSPSNFSHIYKKYLLLGQFPEPVAVLKCGPLWVEQDIIDWKRPSDRRRSRSPKPMEEVVDTWGVNEAALQRIEQLQAIIDITKALLREAVLEALT